MLQTQRNPLMDADAVASRLGLPRWQVYELAKRHIIPSVRLGRRIKFDPDRLEAWIEAGGAGLPEGKR